MNFSCPFTVATRKILHAISVRIPEKLVAISPENESFWALGEIACIFSKILGGIECNLTKNSILNYIIWTKN